MPVETLTRNIRARRRKNPNWIGGTQITKVTEVIGNGTVVVTHLTKPYGIAVYHMDKLMAYRSIPSRTDTLKVHNQVVSTFYEPGLLVESIH